MDEEGAYFIEKHYALRQTTRVVTPLRNSVFHFNTEMRNKGVFLYTYLMNYGSYTSFRNINSGIYITSWEKVKFDMTYYTSKQDQNWVHRYCLDPRQKSLRHFCKYSEGLRTSIVIVSLIGLVFRFCLRLTHYFSQDHKRRNHLQNWIKWKRSVFPTPILSYSWL